MPTEAQINSALSELVADGARFQAIINGSNTTDVLLADNVTTVPSVAKLYASIANQWRVPVRVATTGPLPAATYNNGASGQGATLTATVNGALTIDNRAVAAPDRILVKDQGAAAQNGFYIVTNPGSGAAPFVLTRAVDADTNSDLVVGIATGVQDGDTYKGASFLLLSPLTGLITVGTTALTFGTQASLLTAAMLSGVLRGTDREITGAYAVADTDSGALLNLAGNAFYAVTLGDPTVGFSSQFACEFSNSSSEVRRKDIVIFGYGTVKLYPGQTVRVRRRGTAWTVLDRPGPWRITTDITIFTDDSAGLTTNDGLHASSPIPLSLAVQIVQQEIDCALASQAHVTIQLATGAPAAGLNITEPLRGATYFIIQGNALNHSSTVMTVPNAGTGIYVKHRGFIKLKHMTFGGAGAQAFVWADRLGGIDMYDVVFGSADGGVMLRATEGGSVEFADVCYIAGNAVVFASADREGRINFAGFVHQILVDCNFTGSFVQSINGGLITADAGGGFNLNLHAVSGVRAIAAAEGIIRTPNASATFYPGGSPYDASSGGYIN